MYIIYYATGQLFEYIPVIGQVNLLGMIIAPWFQMYFDIFGALIQAYIFALLTGIYWSQEVSEGLENKETKSLEKLKSKEVLIT